MLDGELSIRCEGNALGTAAGSFVFLPRGAPAPGSGPRTSPPGYC
jgi:ethanolamine utilization protein EutQ (cupin superfamily)